MEKSKSVTVSVREAAMRMKLTQKYVRDLLYEERLPGAKKQDGVWQIPIGAIERHLKARGGRNGN